MSLSTLVFVALLVALVNGDARFHEHVEFSLDSGVTWVRELPHPTTPLPAYVKLRLRDGKSYISLPACAATHGPASIEWRGLNALGVRDAALCEKSNEYSFQHLYTDPIELVPAWHKYLHDSAYPKKKRSMDNDANASEIDENADGEKGKGRRGFWSKYGFYIGAFVCFSLIQGIREGNAQYKQEMEEAARADAAKRAEASSKTNIMVPRRKSKTKKNASKKT